MAQVFISLGSNLGDAASNLATGLQHIEAQIGTLQQKSSIYETAPWGFESFNNFLNQVVQISSDLPPDQIMKSLLIIELQMGRNRKTGGYADRIIDLDLLLIDDCVLESEVLQIPHPRLHLRKFVLVPLAEIAPKQLHPTLSKKIETLLKECEDETEIIKK